MDTTIKQLLIFEDSQFYSLTHAGRHKLTEEELDGLKPGYILMISDSELFYTTMEFPDAPKRKLNLFIGNYLMGSFPQQLCEKFCYFAKGEKILIGIFNAQFAENFAKFESAFSRASYITSPLTSVYSMNDSFTYMVDGAGMTVENGLIASTEEPLEAIEPDWSPNPEAKLTVPFVKNKSAAALDGFKLPAAVLLACYLLFFTGGWFRLQSHTGKLAQAETALEAVYKKAGVSDSKDPYGKLLSMTGGEDSEKYKTLFVLENISRAYNENIKTDVLEIKGTNVTCQGTSADYTFLEQFKASLSKETGKSVTIVDTVQKEGAVTFTLRFDI